MPGPIRKPLAHPSRAQLITPRAIDIFAAMRDLACDCPPRDWGGAYWKHQPCAGCREHARLDSELHKELRLRPWQSVEDPNAESPYPPGHANAGWHDLEAQARWRALDAALAARRRAAP